MLLTHKKLIPVVAPLPPIPRIVKLLIGLPTTVCLALLLAATASAQESRGSDDVSAGGGIEYQTGELVEVSLFDKWIPGRVVNKTADGQFRVKIQNEGRRREANFNSSKIRRIGPNPIIPLTELRQWSDASGKFKIEARLTEMTDENATLLKTNGSKVTVPITKLSDLDQRLIRRLARNRAKREGRDASSNPDLIASTEGDVGLGEAEAARSEGSRREAGPPSDMVAGPAPLLAEAGADSRRAGPPGSAEPEADPPVETALEVDPPLVTVDVAGLTPIPLTPPDPPSFTMGPPEFAESVPSDIPLSPPKNVAAAVIAGMALSEESGTLIVGVSPGGSGSNSIYGIDVRSGSELFQRSLTTSQILQDISSNGNRFATLATRTDGTSVIAVWENTGTDATRLVDLAFSDKRAVQFVRFRTPDSLIVITDSSVFGIDYTANSATPIYQVDAAVTAAVMSPDRSGIALVADGAVTVLAADSGNAMGTLVADGINPIGLAFRPDATRLAVLGNSQVVVFDMSNGAVATTINLPQPTRGNDLLFVNDNHVLVAQSMLAALESGSVTGMYQLQTPHEPGALRSIAGTLWYGVLDPGGATLRLVPVALPDGAASPSLDQPVLLDGTSNPSAGPPGASLDEDASSGGDLDGRREPGRK